MSGVDASNRPVWDMPEFSDDAIREHCYLVARGVRAIALVGHCAADPITMLRAATRLETLTSSSVIPFVVDVGNGVADCGFAAAQWALDLWEWAIKARDTGELPDVHLHQILGLLLGYDVRSIAVHEERCAGRRFEMPKIEEPRP